MVENKYQAQGVIDTRDTDKCDNNWVWAYE